MLVPIRIVREILSISLLIILVLMFRSVFFEPFKIPSGSMIPTLMIGDFILVNKFSYGFKVPFSDYFSDPVYITKPKNPERGDVIVFKYPKDKDVNYIKRVVGLPGDTVEIVDKVVYINDVPISAEQIPGTEIMEDMDDKFRNHKLEFYQVKTGEHKHVIQLDVDNWYNTDYPKTVIPDGQFFVMGDNRDYSSDSRSWRFVPHKNIKGKAILVWFSMIFPWDEDPFKFRPWRIGRLID